MATTSLATLADLEASEFAGLFSALDDAAKTARLVSASRWIEGECGQRRFLTFSGLVERHRGWGVPSDEPRSALAVAGAEIQVDYASQLAGRGAQPGQVWVEQYPTQRTELWAGQVETVTVLQPYAAGSAPTPIAAQTVEFDPLTGFLRFAVGQYVEPGASVTVTYSGGYTTAPEDLTEACLYVAARRRLHRLYLVEESAADGAELVEEIDRMLAPWRRTGARSDR